MSNIPDKVTQALDDYERYTRSAANAATLERGQANTFRDLKRAEVEAAIDEAITRGKAEPAPESSASDLIDALEAEAEALSYKPMAPKRTESYLAARSALERYVSTLERERADAINRYNSADAERANLEMRLEQALAERNAIRDRLSTIEDWLQAERAEHAQAARDRDEMGRMYAIESNRVTHFESELTKARAEIASLNETLSSCDSLKLAEELEAMRVERAGLQADLGIARGERDYAREIIKNTGARVSDHAERLRVMRGWLDVLAQGYLTPEGVTAGARKAIDALTVIIRDITGNPKG